MLLSKRLIPEGLSDYAKATPPSVQHSHKHQLLHYPRSADAFGSLSGSWMFTDERRNKVIPNPNTHARTHTHTTLLTYRWSRTCPTIKNIANRLSPGCILRTLEEHHPFLVHLLSVWKHVVFPHMPANSMMTAIPC